jgi:hypothetical protein
MDVNSFRIFGCFFFEENPKKFLLAFSKSLTNFENPSSNSFRRAGDSGELVPAFR